MWRKLVLLFGVILAVGIVGVVVLVNVFDLRMQVDGSGMRPLFSFDDRDAHYDALEQHRQAHRALAPPRASAATPGRDPSAEPAPPGNPPVESPASVSSPPPETASPETARDPASADRSSGAWTDFRGPRRDGRYSGPSIRTEWPPEGPPRLWLQPIGGGYASFVIAEGRAFTIEQRRDREAVAAYDVDTGRELWAVEWPALFTEAMGGDGPRATPTWHDGRVYALGAIGEFRCLDAATGSTIWRRNILDDQDAANLTWAMSAAPLIVGDVVVVLPGGSRGRSVAAYDRLTGEPRWTSLDDVQAYTSPILATLGGVQQILVVTASRVVGLTTDEGRLLWEYPWVVPTVPNIAQPLELGGDRLFLSASYGHGAAVIEIRRSGDRFNVDTVWRNTRMKNKFSSSVLHDGYVYGLDEAILACIDPETGELMWKGGRYGYGQLLLADGHLVVLTERGDVVFVRATPERHEEVARFAGIEGKTWNVPALADGRLLVRNAQQMAGFDLRR